MNLRDYSLVTGAYWAFTVSDGALRMLVLLHFHDLGYSPVSLAFLFLLYELMGVATNLVGGWLGSVYGLNRTLHVGLALQVVALTALSFQDPGWAEWLSVAFVMGMQALSGVAKDLTKMSSKSAVKLVVGDGALFHWVAVLTGSKNALKGVGFFLGGALLAGLGFAGSLRLMAAVLAGALVVTLLMLRSDLGRSTRKASVGSLLSKSPAINRLAAARFFLFGARDIWFVVALPVYLDEVLGWSFQATGGFLAAWVIGYGIIQSAAPRLLRGRAAELDEVAAARRWVLALTAVTAAIALSLTFDTATRAAVLGGLLVFGAVFALNSSLHSFLILAYSSRDEVAMDVGFYYSANAAGRLVGTLLSGVLYLAGDLAAGLWGSAGFLAMAWALSARLPPLPADQPATAPS